MAQSSIQSYRDLLVWQRAMRLARPCYELCKQLPDDERFGLVSQIRRACISIPANIAEGHGRELAGSFVQHLRISQGSLKELETLLLLTRELGLVPHEAISAILLDCDELGRMIRSLVRSIQEKT